MESLCRQPDLIVRTTTRKETMNTIQEIEQEQVAKLTEKKSIPKFSPGDTIKVNVKVVEGARERIQAFEGMCIGRKNNGLHSSFTVRKLSYGEGVERVFPVYSPNVESIEVIRRGDVRRANCIICEVVKGSGPVSRSGPMVLLLNLALRNGNRQLI